MVSLTETDAGNADHGRPVVARIRDIVGLGRTRPADADTVSLLAQGRQIDAMRQLRETEGLGIGEAKTRVDAAGRRTD